jgi:hypothetical protein
MYIMQGKPDQYITRSVRVWPSTIRISHDPRITTFRESPTDLDGSYCSRATGIPNYIPSTLAGRSVGPHPFSLPLKTGEAIGLSQDSFDNKLLVLLVSYTSMRSVRSILARGGQPISLTQAGPITLEVTVEAGDRARGRGSGWNGATWADRRRVVAGSLPRARLGEQCHFQIIRFFLN